MTKPARPLAVLDAPSNLGLKPPAGGRWPGGLSQAEMHELLTTLLDSGLAVGIQVTNCDPGTVEIRRIKRCQILKSVVDSGPAGLTLR